MIKCVFHYKQKKSLWYKLAKRLFFSHENAVYIKCAHIIHGQIAIRKTSPDTQHTVLQQPKDPRKPFVQKHTYVVQFVPGAGAERALKSNSIYTRNLSVGRIGMGLRLIFRSQLEIGYTIYRHTCCSGGGASRIIRLRITIRYFL